MTEESAYKPLPMPHGRTGPAPAPLVVRQGSLPSDLMDQARARLTGPEVLVLPREAEAHLRDGDPTVAVYNDSDMAAVQTLRRAGAPVDFLAEQRKVIAQFSAEVWIDFAVQVGADVAAATVTAIAGYLTGLTGKQTDLGWYGPVFTPARRPPKGDMEANPQSTAVREATSA